MFFRDIPGHDKVKEQLQEMAASGRIPHAMLLAERKIVGGLPLALAFARLLHCKTPKDGDGCGQCPSCKQIDQLAHPDLILSYPIVKKGSDEADSEELTGTFRSAVLKNPMLSLNEWQEAMEGGTKQSLIPVGEASRLLHICSLKKFNSDYRVVVLWLPERLNGPAANKLLKLIEEPKEGTIFLLVTRNPDQVLTTILSRCQTLHLQSLSTQLITDYLVTRAGVASDQALVAAQLSEGDLNAAMHTAQMDETLLLYTDWFVRWTRICYAAKLSDLLDWSAEVGKSGRDSLIAYLKFSSSLLEESLKSKHGISTYEHPALVDAKFKMNVFSGLLTSSAVEHMYLQIDDALASIQRNIHSKLVLFNLGVEMMRSFKMKD